MMVKDVIAKSSVLGRHTVTLSKGVASGFYTVDAGSIGYLRTKDKQEAKEYYRACIELQLR